MSEKQQINTKELQRFLDTWGPMLAALPAVINAAEYEAELGRHVKILESQRDQTVAEAEASKKSLSDSVDKARSALKEIEVQRKVAADELRDFKQRCEVGKKAAEKATDDAVARFQERAMAAGVAAAEAEATRDARIKAVDDDVLAAVAAGKVEIDAIEERRAAAQKALDDLRASLAG